MRVWSKIRAAALGAALALVAATGVFAQLALPPALALDATPAQVQASGPAIGRTPVGSPTYVINQPGGFIDLSPLVGGFIGPLLNALLPALIPLIVAWIGVRYHQITGRNMDKSVSDRLDRILTNEASSLVADGEVKFQGLKITTPNANLTEIADRIIATLPEASSRLGVTPELVAARIIDKIPQTAAGAAVIAAQHQQQAQAQPRAA